jgi:NCS1 family nucleobase:cation symporter-1
MDVDEALQQDRPSGQVAVEAHSVDYVPAGERHGKSRDLFSFWFAENQQILTLTTGSLAVIFGLNLFWSIVAVVVGNLVGTVFAAYHSAQGPQMGVPQMIQTRAQFGFYGAFLFFVATFFLQFGFFASASALSGQTLNQLSSGISVTAGILIVTVPIAALAIFGYRYMHAWQKVAAVILTLTFALVTVRSIAHGGLPEGAMDMSAPNWAVFLAVTAIMATYTISWAPFVADYSRYLPKETGVGSTFWHTYGGISLACIWLEILGSALVLQFKGQSGIAAMKSLTGGWVLIIVALSLVGAGASNLYGGMLALISMLSTWKSIEPSRLLRVVGVAVTTAVGLVCAIVGAGSFLKHFTDFLLVLLFVFVPWTAVNLTDFYLIRRGRYDIASLFTPRGIYGGVNWRGMAAYFVGLLVSLPFLNSSLWVGPAAKAMGGADISWVIGLILPAVLYWLLNRRTSDGTGRGVAATVDTVGAR